MAIEVNEHKVHTGTWPTSRDHLDSLQRITSKIVEIYFFRRVPDNRHGLLTKIDYDRRLIRNNKSGLDIRIQTPDHAHATLSFYGLKQIDDIFDSLDLIPSVINRAVGRKVNAYTNGGSLYGIWIPGREYGNERY